MFATVCLLSLIASRPAPVGEWLADAIVLEERAVQLSDGRRLLYVLAPTTHSVGDGTLKQALFLFDAKGALVGAPVDPAADPTQGCPSAGSVTTVEERDHRVAVESETERCLLEVRPKGLTGFPELTKSFAENYPTARDTARRLTKHGLYPLPRSLMMLASASERCELIIFDRSTGAIDEAASVAATDAVCSSNYLECVESVEQTESGTAKFVVQRGELIAECSGGGTAQILDACVFRSTVADCHSTVGRPFSPRQLEELESRRSDEDRAAEARSLERTDASEKALQALEAVSSIRLFVDTTTEAKRLWRASKRGEALELWRRAYRAWVVDGRRVTLEIDLGVLRDVIRLTGRPLDLNRLRVQTISEALTDFADALRSMGEAKQADGALLERTAWLAATSRR